MSYFARLYESLRSSVIPVQPVRERMLVEAIEPRILHSADLSPLQFTDQASDTAAELRYLDSDGEFIREASSAQQEMPREVIFVDSSTPDYQDLIDHIVSESDNRDQYEIILIDAESDGFDTITSALESRSDLSAVHIISHGSDGNIELGSSNLTSESLAQRAGDVAGWAAAFSDNGDILIYGCNLAASEVGQALVNDLAALTCADVAASDDLTGHASLGGDWELEYARGDIETAIGFGSDVQENWVNILPPSAAITARETVDSDGNGQIDHIKMTAEGALDDDFSDINITVGGYTLAATPYVTNIGAGGALDDAFYVALVESGSADTDATPAVTVTANSNLKTQGPPARAIATDGGVAATDTAGPAVLAKDTADLNSDGYIDAIHVTFSEAIQDSTVSASDWDVAGVGGETFVWNTNGDSADDADIYISFADGVLDTGAAPDVTYTQGTLADAASNLLASDSADAWWDAQWLNRTKITFDNSASAANLTDFPVLVTLTAADVDFTKIKAGGADIRFVDNSGALLDYEIEAWDDGTETASVWVRVPQIDAGSTTDFIHIYYNNAAATDAQNAALVWDGGLGVWHLGEDPGPGGAGDIKDSDASPNDGTAGASMTASDLVTGQIGNAVSFDGVDDFIDFAAVDVGNTFTIQAWVKPDSSGTGIQTIVANSSPGVTTDGFRFFINQSGTTNGEILFESGNGGTAGTARSAVGVINFDAWNHVAVQVDRASGLATIFHNGTDVTVDNTIRNDFNTSSDWEIGRMEGSLEFTGEIDEVRMTTVARSADWINASYLSQNGTFAFNTFGGEQVATIDKAAPVLLSASSPQSIGSNLFQLEGQILDLVFSETLSAAPTEANLEAALQFAAGATDGDNLPTIGSGANPVSLVTTTLTDDTIRVTYNTNNTVNADALLVGTHTAQIISGVHITDTASNTASTGAAVVTINGDINDAPVLDNSGAPTFTTITEEDTANGGDLVSAIVATTITDADALPVEGIAVTALNSGNGTWQYNTGSGWTDLGVVSDASALLLRSNDSLRFVPDTLTADSASVTYRAWDRTSGGAGAKVNVGAGGGSSAFSVAADTATITVTEVNDAPTVNATASDTGSEDTDQVYTHAQMLALIGAGDVDDANANLSVSISNVLNGTLAMSGGSGGAGTTFTFTPTANFVGDMSFDYQVSDDEAPTPASSAAGTATVTLSAVNDAPTFDIGNGFVTNDVAGGNDPARSITLQPDGKILVAGSSVTGSYYDFSLTRFNSDGSVDTSFNGTGSVTTAIGSGDAKGRGVVVQPDGKILVAGESDNGTNKDFALVRYNADGSLDTGFNLTGIVVTAIGAGDDIGQWLALQPDGKILVTGYSDNGTNMDVALVRYNADGSLDTSFDGDGIVTTPVGADFDHGMSVALQNDGKILVAGQVKNATEMDFLLLRYNADGSLDTSFDTDGIVTTPIGSGDDAGRSVTVQSDGKILVTGYSYNGTDNDFTLVRYNADGSLDSGFGAGGIVTTDLGDDFGFSVTTQPDGKILVGGYSHNGTDYDFAMLRYNADGSPDTSFNGGGAVTTAISAGADIAYSVALQPDGKILLGGFSGGDFALVRYNADGRLDTSFDAGVATSSLDGNPTFVEDGAAVVLDVDVDVIDAELDALNGGVGNYSGASLVLARNSGAASEDIFAFNDGSGITSSGGNLVKNGQIIATFDVTTTPGELVITFTDANGEIPTPADVDNILRQITYANSSNTPPASVQVDWTFDDGNSGAQGTGGALQALGSTVINITAANDAPVANDDSYSVWENGTLVVNALNDNATSADLEAAWQMDEGAGTSITDVTGNGNDGTLNGAAWTTSSRTGNAALTFDGVDDYVQTTNTTLDLSTATSFTLSAWFQTDTTAGAHHLLWQGVSTQNGWGDPGDNTPTSSEMHLTVGRYDANDKITFFLGYDVNDPNSIDISSASNFTDTSGWHHAVVVVSDLGGGTLQADLYVDSVLEGSDTGTQTDRSQWDSDLRIGQPGTAERFFDGAIDEVGIYDRALTTNEVSALHATGILTNDTDAESDPLTVNTTPVSGVSNGTLTLNTDGSFTYTPNAGFTGVDTFTYEVTDGALTSNTATVTINVVNTPPVAADDPGDFDTTVSSHSPLSYWRLGESSGGTAADAGGTGNDASFNGVTLGQTGVVNGDPDTAIHFDGTDDYVEIAHDDSYLIDDGTIQLWFNADALAADQGLFSKDSAGLDTGGHFTIRLLTNGQIEARLQSTSGDNFLYSGIGSVAAGSWHHVAVTFGSAGMELFLDGSSVATNAYTGGLGTTSGGVGNYEPIAIGASTRTSDDGLITPLTDYFSGSIDEVAIIGQALTPAQIRNLFSSALQNYTLMEESSLVVPASEGVLINDADPESDPLTATLVSGPSNAASFTFNPDGSFTYTPLANFSGTDIFTYVANDGTSDSNVATVTITVTNINDAPTVNATASDTGSEDTDQVYTHAQMLALIGAGDVDDANANLSVSISNVLNGTLAMSGGSGGAGTTFTFTPTANFVGDMSFDYQVSDDEAPTPASSAVGTATVTLSAVNDAPTVNATASDTGSEDTDQVYTHAQMLALIGAGDVDDANANLSVSISNVLNGTLAMSGGSGGAGTTFTFTPTANFVGDMSFDYQVSDDEAPTPASSAVGTATVTLSAVNDAPTVNATASDTGSEDTDQVYTHAQMLALIGAGDVDDANANLSVSISNVLNGTLAMSGGSGGAGTTFTFTPTANFVGDMSFDYQVSDDEAPTPASSAVGTATVTLSAVNDAPTVNATASDTGSEDTDQVYTHAQMLALIGAGDVDDANANLSVSISNVLNGTLAMSGGSGGAGTTFTFTPTANFVGDMSFDYQVSDDEAPTPASSAVGTATVTLSAVNDAPTVNATASDTGSEDTDQVYTHAQMLALIGAGDVDDANANLSVSISNVLNGTLAMSGGSGGAGTTFTFTPTANFVGDMSFDYQVSDDEAPTPASSAVGTATVTLSAVNDAPTVNATASDTGSEDTDQVYTHAQMLALIGAGDVDDANANLSVSISNVLNGTLAMSGGSGGAGTTFTFTPTANFVGDMSFDYQVSDDEAPTPASSAVGTATVTLSAVNDAPTVNATASDTGSEDTDQVYTHAQMLALIGAGDVDDANANLSVSISNVLNGTLAMSGGSGGAGTTFTFTPTANFVGDMSFDYQVSDDEAPTPASSAVGTATVTLSAVNDAPTVNATASDTGSEDTDQVYTHAQMLALIGAGDVDDANANLSVSISNVLNGTLAMSGGSGGAGTTFTFTPTANFVGDMSFDYQVSDDEAPTPASSAVGTATVTLSAVNDAPTVNATASDTGSEDTDQVYTHAQMLALIGAGDVDDANANLSVSISNVLNGTLAMSGGSGGAGTTFTFTPTANFVGDMSFDYQVSDDEAPTPASSAVGTATVTLSAVNDAPTVNATASDTGSEDTDQVYTHAQMLALIGAGDVDDANANLSVSISNVLNGTLAMSGGSGGAGTTFTFTPTANFVGDMSFDYQVSDDEAPTPASSAVGTATVTLSAVNDAPTVNATASDTGSEDTDQVYTHAQMLALIGAGDVDDANANLSVSISNVLNGTLAMSGGSGGAGTTFTFTPTANFVGDMSFDYQVSDDEAPTPASSAVGTATVTLSAVNDAPTVNATASDTGSEDTDQVYTHAQMLALIGAGDVDDANANLSVSISNVLNGTLAMSGGSGGAGTTFTFTPTANFVGDMSFDYQVSDDEAPTPASSAVGTATVTLSAVNDAPTVNATASDTGSEDTDQVYTHAQMLALIGAGDVDDANANLSVSISNVLNGTLAMSGGSGGAGTTFTFTPTANFVGDMSFDYQVSDDEAPTPASSAVGTATVTLSAVNDAPTVNATASDTGSEDTDQVYTHAQMLALIGAGDVDDANANLSVSISNVLNGTLAMSGGSGGAGTTFTFTPTANFVGDMSFDYQVSDDEAPTPASSAVGTATVTLSAVNDAPTVNATASDTGSEDTDQVYTHAQMLALIGAGDVDDANANLSVSISNVLNGTLAMSGGSGGAGTTFTFTPTANFVGDMSFDYQVSDDEAPTPASSAVGTATVTLSAVNDAPTVNATASDTGSEDTDQVYTHAQMLALIGAGDVDDANANLSVSISNVLNGTLAMSGGSGGAGTTFTFTPTANFVGDMSFDYQVSDDEAPTPASSAVGTATVTLSAVNDAPTVNATASDTGSEDTDQVYTHAQMLALIGAGDVDDANANLSVSISNVLNGTLAMSGGSGGAGTTFTFTPTANFVGDMSFDYQVSDDEAPTPASSAVGTATVTLSAVNDAPTTSPVTLTAIAEDSGARAITQAELLANAADIDGPALTATGLAINAGSGSLNDNGDGTWDYTPAANDDTSVEFTYNITDGINTVAGSASLDITPVDDVLPTTVDVEFVIPPVADPFDFGELAPNATGTEEDGGVLSTSNSATSTGALEGSVAPTSSGRPFEFTSIAYEPQRDMQRNAEAPVGATRTKNDLAVIVDESDDSERTVYEWLISRMLLADEGETSGDESSFAGFTSGLAFFGDGLPDQFTDFDEKGQVISLTDGVQFASIALTAGAVSWAIRAGGLLTSLLAGMPVWRDFDPLPVVSEDEDEKKTDDESDEKISEEEAVAAHLLGGGKGSKGARQ